MDSATAGGGADTAPESSWGLSSEPRIVPRAEHGISRSKIDEDALAILYRLHKHGHKGFLVGGSVRDLMLGIPPKDFDIATDARPRRLKRIFKNCRIIGRRFRLAHLHFADDKIIEVATFRSSGESDEVVRDGELIQRDNVFGSPEEDALRRDLTVNALFYSIADFSVIDYVGGVEDLQNRTIRTIGDPERSFREDPVRILRAIRHATRLSFHLEERTRAAIESEKAELLKVNQARLLEELYKDLTSGRAAEFIRVLENMGILEVLMPELVARLDGGEGRRAREWFYRGLARLDEYCKGGTPVSHAVALSALFSPFILPVAELCMREPEPEPHPPWEPFRAALASPIKNLRIYRRDEERLWHVLGAWPKLLAGFERRKVPASLLRRTYFEDVLEVSALLGDAIVRESTSEFAEFLEQARNTPRGEADDEPEEDEAPRRRRRRRPRRRRRGGGGGAGGGVGGGVGGGAKS